MYSHCICSPETGITLFVNQRGYIHSEPPVVIRTVIVVKRRPAYAQFVPRTMPTQSRVHAYVHPPLLLCPLLFFPRQDCDDCPAPSSAFRLPPPPANPDPDGGDAATPEGSNSAKSLSRRDSNLSPTLSGISAAPPVVVIVVLTAVVIIAVVDETPVSTSSLRFGRPMTRGPVDVDVAAAGRRRRNSLISEVFPPPPVGGGGGIGRSGCFFSPSPVLAERADNDNDNNKGGRII
jgi:hypothetical protein